MQQLGASATTAFSRIALWELLMQQLGASATTAFSPIALRRMLQ
jgi:hypothetical protein